MKTLYLSTIIILISITGCKKDNIANESEFNKSYNTWLSFKSTAHNTYLYTTTFGSWTGYGAEIKTGVVNGKVAWRDFVSTQLKRNGTSQIDTIKQWHEDADDIVADMRVRRERQCSAEHDAQSHQTNQRDCHQEGDDRARSGFRFRGFLQSHATPVAIAKTGRDLCAAGRAIHNFRPSNGIASEPMP